MECGKIGRFWIDDRIWKPEVLRNLDRIVADTTAEWIVCKNSRARKRGRTWWKGREGQGREGILMPRFFRYENSGRRGKMRSLNRPLCVFGIFARSRGNGALFSRRVARQRSTVFQDKEERFTKLQLAMILKIFRQRTLARHVGLVRSACSHRVYRGPY